MTPKRWQQIERIFHSALEREPKERATFLDEACGDDESLRKEVESLLNSDEQAESSIDALPSELAAQMLTENQAETVVGRTVGRYQIISLLGAGGMGEVYLAEDTTLKRKVALKILPSQFTKNPERVRRFEQEARAASALNHPNIITIYEIGKQDEIHFIATELVEGKVLRERLQQDRMPLKEILDLGTQIAGALAAAHKAGIVHRDIKPANIMVRKDGYAKVLDFGLAKLIGGETVPSAETSINVADKTDPGRVMGTVNYMSPEQARGKEVDERTDIWSLGVVLYEMVAGRLPFEGETASDRLALILTTEPQPLSKRIREVPRELEHIISKALRKNYDERYQHIMDLQIDLRDLTEELEFEAKLERSQPSEPDSDEDIRPHTKSYVQSTSGASNIHSTSSAEYIVQTIQKHRRGAVIVLAIVIVALLAITYFVYKRYSASTDTAGIDSIAVLPFSNETGDPNTDYLSDGIAESLINDLSQLPGMKVIARSSAFRYKGKQIDPKEVARSLGVKAILTGSVSRRGENILISVELIDSRNQAQIWGAHYDRRATDLLAVQSEISGEIVEKLRLRLTTGEQQHLAKRETANPEAYELMLKGRFYRDRAGKENRKKAVDFFLQAVSADPNYALAYAELSRGYRGLTTASLIDPKEGTPKAADAARRSLELDEGLPDAHYAMAYVRQDSWDWAGAEHEFKRAVELNSNYARAHQGYSAYLSIMGRHDQAIGEAKRARELDPVSPQINIGLAWVLYFARQYDLSIEASKKALELEPNHPTAHLYLGYCYSAKGMYAEAIAEVEQVIKQLDGDTPSVKLTLGLAYARAGQREKAQSIIRQLQTSGSYISPFELATLYGALNERENGIASLEKGVATHDPQMQYLNVEPAADSLRSDPRFADIVRRVGLQP